MASSSILSIGLLPQDQVFINFRGDELRTSFVRRLTKAWKENGVNVFMDEHLNKGTPITKLFKKIEESRIALAIFSMRYSESKWCLDELVKINERVNEGQLVAVPIFYKLETSDVKELKGDFGDNFKIRAYKSEHQKVIDWEKALMSICGNMGMTLKKDGDEGVFIDSIIEFVKDLLIDTISTGGNTGKEELDEPLYGMKQCLEKLEEKLDAWNGKTCIVGVVGMPGIGKTALAKSFYNRWEKQFAYSMCLADVSKMLNEHGPNWLQMRLLRELLKDTHPLHQIWKDELLKRKFFVVLDDVNGKEQIEYLLGNLDWIKEGSKIVITTSDKSLVQNLVNYTFVVPILNDEDGLKCFTYHAFGPNNPPPEENYLRLSRKILDYAKGNPLFLKELGVELLGKEEEDWEKRVGTLTQSSSPKIQDALSKRYLELSEKQKDAFLDIACFFRSKTTSYVRCMLDSCDSGVIGDLTDRFLISISGGRVEMHDVLYTFGKELASRVQCRLWNHKKIVRMLKYKSEMENVRGVYLDMSEVKEKMSFTSMRSLRYLKIYSSICPMECKADQIIVVAEGLQFTLAEVRCLDWLRFSLDKLPLDFNAKNLVNLSLPYSSIKQVWEGVKDTPNLKWVDLNHSLNLSDLSGLSNAQNLERLNLEGCRRRWEI